ncbi:MAG: DUF4397 domain-containing protein [Chitinophagales bacterium]
MKKLSLTIVITLLTVVGLRAQTAFLQAIHNAADPSVDTVDVYVNGSLLIDNFAFRNATAFAPVPAGVQIQIEIAPDTSTSNASAIDTFSVGPLVEDSSYVLIANGVVDTTAFDQNPDAQSISLDLYLSLARQLGQNGSGNVDFLGFHGVTDGEAVDVEIRGSGTLIDNLLYGDFQGYSTLAEDYYILDVKDSTGSNVIGSFVADLNGIGGNAAVVFASGFLNASQGEAFGLFAAFPNGDVVELPEVGNARVQVIHNSADPLTDTVDIYLNGGLILDDFAFREASPFIDVEADVPVEIVVAESNGSSIDTFNLGILTDGEAYILTANGVLAPGVFDPNPDGLNISFDLYTYTPARELGQNGSGNVDLLAFHGATDAQAIDIDARGVGTLFDNMLYGEYQGYISVPEDFYVLDVKDSTGTITLGSFIANLNVFGGRSAVIFASGFVDASQGQSFGLFAAFSNGNVVKLPTVGTARVQMIHNAADPFASTVDVYVNGSLFIDNFEFREATPYTDMDAGIPVEVILAPSNSTSAADGFDTLDLGFLTDEESYVVTVSGVANPGSFDPNPDGFDIALDLYSFSPARETGQSSSYIDVLTFHGVTDAPHVDIDLRNIDNLTDDIRYGEYVNYDSVPEGFYVVDVKDSSGINILGSFIADFNGLNGNSIVLFASGFMDVSQGEELGLSAAFPGGNVVELVPVDNFRAQIIHNAADTSINFADIYIVEKSTGMNNNYMLLDNFRFRNATPFHYIPADLPFDIVFADSSSTSIADSVAEFNFPGGLMADSVYTIIANGVINTSDYTPNPDGASISFDLFIKEQARIKAQPSSMVNVNAFHGVTDGATIDIDFRDSSGVEIDDLTYGNFSNGYLNFNPEKVQFDVTDETGNTVIQAYDLPLSLSEGDVVTIFASGFIDSTQGYRFGLYATFPEALGDEYYVIPLPKIGADDGTFIDEKIIFNNLNIYPNPTSDFLKIDYNIKESSELNIRIVDINGKVLFDKDLGKVSEGDNNQVFNVSELSAGTYFVQFIQNQQSFTVRPVIVKN